MIKVIEIRKAIGDYLETKHPEVYFQIASKDAAPLHLTFDLPNSFDDGAMENFVLEIDGWDLPEHGDTTALETLMDEVDKGLHREVFRIAGMSMAVYRENRLALEDDDKHIRRRKYVYQVRTFGGG